MLKSRALCRALLVLFVVIKFPLSKILSYVQKDSSQANRRILVLCGAHMGDVLCLFPTLHLLRQLNPNSEISFPVSPSLCSFLKRSPARITPIPFDERDVLGNLKLFLRFHFYDEAYAFWNKRDLLLCHALGAKHVTASERAKHKYYAFLVDSFGKATKELNFERIYELFALDIYGQKAKEALSSLHYCRDEYFPEALNVNRDKVVILHACCQSKNRMCPPNVWREIASYVHSLGYGVLFTGRGKSEKEFIEKCDPEHLYKHAVDLFSIDELALTFIHSTLLITVDTGVLHLAKYTGIKVLALCGGSNPTCICPSEFFDNDTSATKKEFPTHINRDPFYTVCSDFKCQARNPHCGRTPQSCYHWDGESSECMRALKVDDILQKTRTLLLN